MSTLLSVNRFDVDPQLVWQVPSAAASGDFVLTLILYGSGPANFSVAKGTLDLDAVACTVTWRPTPQQLEALPATTNFKLQRTVQNGGQGYVVEGRIFVLTASAPSEVATSDQARKYTQAQIDAAVAAARAPLLAQIAVLQTQIGAGTAPVTPASTTPNTLSLSLDLASGSLFL